MCSGDSQAPRIHVEFFKTIFNGLMKKSYFLTYRYKKSYTIPGYTSEGIVTRSVRALMKTVEKIGCHLVFSLNIRKSHLEINSQSHLYKTILIWLNIILSVIHLLVFWIRKDRQQLFNHNKPHTILTEMKTRS